MTTCRSLFHSITVLHTEKLDSNLNFGKASFTSFLCPSCLLRHSPYMIHCCQTLMIHEGRSHDPFPSSPATFAPLGCDTSPPLSRCATRANAPPPRLNSSPHALSHRPPQPRYQLRLYHLSLGLYIMRTLRLTDDVPLPRDTRLSSDDVAFID
jgi:hypothetical protein